MLLSVFSRNSTCTYILAFSYHLLDSFNAFFRSHKPTLNLRQISWKLFTFCLQAMVLLFSTSNRELNAYGNDTKLLLCANYENHYLPLRRYC